MRAVFLPLGFLIRFFFYKPLVKLYYGFFRLRQSGLTSQSLDLRTTRLRHLLFFILIAFILVLNLAGANPNQNPQATIYQTILAKLIPDEFGNIEDQTFIEDNTAAAIINSKQDKYLGFANSVANPLLLNPGTNEESAYLSFASDNSAIIKPNFLTVEGGSAGQTNATPKRQGIISYTVAIGDTVSTIASKFSISVNTILWANNLTAFSLIRPGDKLNILPASGVLHVVAKGDTLGQIAKTYGITTDQIVSNNDLGDHLVVGQKLIIPGGKKLSSSNIARATRNTGVSGVGVIAKLIKSPKATPAANKMNWPTGGYRITQYFSWRHPGVDIANKVGTPIYAADSGVVVIAQGGWNGGYGNTIVIDHGGGKKTRYGHASKLFVKVGQTVEKGENIAAMGSTGRSTGPHLHFEVMINGSKYNPLNYIR